MMRRFGTGRAWPGVVAFAAVLLALACFSAPAVAQPAVGGQWHMDELDNGGNVFTTPDSSGNGEDLQGGSANLAPGRFQNAIAFGGLQQFSTPGTPSLEPAQLTVMAWVKRLVNSPAPGAFKYIVEDGADGTCNAASYGLYTGSSGGAQFFVWTPSGPAFSAQADPSVLWDGNWHAIAGVYDGTAVHLYVDGSEVGSPTAASQPIDYSFASQEFFVGNYPCANFGFRGAIDEVRVYDGALTAAEVNQLQTATGDTPPVLQEPPPPPPPPPGTTPTPSPTPTPTPGGGLSPVARFSPSGPSQMLKGAVWVNAVGSFTPFGRKIVDYAWDPTGTGNYTDPCGSSPIASLQYKRPGAYTVGLQVTDNTGAVSTTSQRVMVTKSMINAATLAATTFDCENPVAGGNQPSTADCVKTFAWSIIEVNSRGNPDDCFQISSRHGSGISVGLAAGDAKSPRLRRPLGLCAYYSGCDYHASIKGPVALNGLYIPMSEKFSTVYDTGTGAIGIGTLPLRLGPFGTQQLDLSKQLALQTLGPDDACYPQPTQGFPFVPSGLLAAGGKIGGLPLSAGVEIDLLDHSSRAILNVGLPNIFTLSGTGDPVQGKVCLNSDNVNGVSFDGVKVSVPSAFIGPIALENLSFTYNQPADLWEGGAKVVLPPDGFGLDAAAPPPDQGFGIRNGQFDHAGIGVDFPIGAQPELFPGVFLSNVHLDFGVNPIRLTGGIGLNAAQIVNINGDAFVAAPSVDDPYYYPATTGDLAPLSGKTFTSTTVAVAGNASARVPFLGSIPLANGYVLYEYPDYFEFGGGVSFEPPFLKLSGTMSGFLDPGQAFDLEGKISACVRDALHISIGPADLNIQPCFDTGAVISSSGIAFCGTIPVPVPIVGVVPVEITVGYHWGDSLPSIYPFSCKTSNYSVATTHHAGDGRAAAAGLALPAHLSSAAIRLTGAGGAPDAVLTGPGGQTISTANPPAVKNVVVIRLPDFNQTVVGIRDPKGGRWSVVPAAGGTPVTSVAISQALPPAHVHLRITGRGAHRTLRYRMTRAAGRTVTFIEAAPGVHHIIGRVRASHGTLHFTPAPGRGGRRQIVAEELENGLMIGRSVVGSYVAPREARPGAPSHLKATHPGMRLRVRWAGVPGAAEYLATLMLSGGRRDLEITRAPRASFAEVPSSVGGRVQVIAVSTMNLRGRPAYVAFKGLPARRRPTRRRHHR